MKVLYTALADLGEIADWLAMHYPAIAPTVERRIRMVVAGIGDGRKARAGQQGAPACGGCLLGVIPTGFFIGSLMMPLKSSTFIMPRGDPGTRREITDDHFGDRGWF